MPLFQPIIGLEVHLELKTKSKMFCGCSADHFGKTPNTLCCPVCLGLPGALPVPNEKAVEWTILLGLALNCQIPRESYFERKNYFYPDLPKGYQISQYHQPLAIDGHLKLKIKNEKLKIIRIQRVHLEEDTAKLIHQFGTKGCTLIDFNRSGVPLVEIVSEPDISSAEEAKIYLQKIQQIARYLEISSADMEKGSMRCEPNVNLRILDQGKWRETPIVEIKNINSFHFVKRAIEFEIKRQVEEYEKTKITKTMGNKTTRGFDEGKMATYPQRQKEEAFDYRYFPEPDIPVMEILRYWDIKKLGASLPELPNEKLNRFVKQYGLTEYQAGILTEGKKLADYFEEAARENEKFKIKIANWLINKKPDIEKVTPQEFVKMIVAEKEKKGLPEEELARIVERVVGENQKAVEDYRKGKEAVLMFLVGQVQKASSGKADPKQAQEILREKLQA